MSTSAGFFVSIVCLFSAAEGEFQLYLPICQDRVSLTVISLLKIPSSSFLTHVSAIFPGKSSDNSMGLRQCCDRIQAWRSSKLFILVTITLGLFAGKIIADLSNFVLMFVYAVL